ncbi:hypothetical protein BS50DRAFT_325041 [Corynespora cassiicola Philippines]|uniref:Uncharacterized protein n=1 Tax=Corynespora cassiicola Philippines TaxID=1448308 RepID=A0A2T2NTX0_CORCC|nr:hypothetical protein BS50DRAFT_325041 [Corynespora cassiicola Philippines]
MRARCDGSKKGVWSATGPSTGYGLAVGDRRAACGSRRAGRWRQSSVSCGPERRNRGSASSLHTSTRDTYWTSQVCALLCGALH